MRKIENCPVCSSEKVQHFISTSVQMHSDKEVFKFDQCTDCEFVFLNPKVSPEQLNNYYTKYYLPYRGAEAWGKYGKLVNNSLKKLDLRKLKFVNSIIPLQNRTIS